MLIYDFTKREPKESKYEYLYQCLKNDILNGKISEGDKMPSKRELAASNEVSIKTVMNAYDQLIMEGFLESRERSGYYVVSNFTPQLRYQNPEFSDDPEKKEDGWIADFTSNTTVYEKFPFSVWTKVMRQVLADYNVELMKWGDFLGSRELRVEIARHLYHTRSMMVSPDCIVIGSGIEYLYSRLIRLLPPDSIYAVENPGYRKIPHIYEENGVKWTWVSMGEGGIHMSSLQNSQATVVHTSPEHHYPLGTVMTAKRRQELLKWLEEKKERYIIEDDYDCEFRYRGRPISALYSLDQSHHVIYMNTFSKTLSPAIRISYMILPEHLLKKYVDTAGFFSNTSSNLEQYTLARFFRDGCFNRHLNRMRKYYHLQGEQLADTIKNTPSIPAAEISGIESGTHLLVKLNTELSDQEIKKRAEEKQIHLCCLSEFCLDSSDRYQHTLVLNYTSMNAEQMQEVVQKLGEIF